MPNQDPRYTSEGERDYRYSEKDGKDLLAPINLNQNPFDIKSVNGQPVPYVWEKMVFFYKGFLPRAEKAGLITPGDTSINSDAKLKAFTNNIISKFNTDENLSDWLKYGKSDPHRGYNNPLTTEDLKAIQTFNSITDSNVIVDGALGTQTLRLSYPQTWYGVINTMPQTLNEVKDLTAVIPAIWGNKRFAVNIKDYYKYIAPRFPDNTEGPSTFSLTTLYNPAEHDKKFIYFNPLKTQAWIQLGIQANPNLSAEKINNETIKTQKEKVIALIQTKLSK